MCPEESANAQPLERPPFSSGLHVAHRAVELVADQDAVADDVPALGLHALVVVADRGQAVLDGAVAGDVHDVGAVLQRVELVVGRERRAGVVGLVAERAVELGGVADRLVDGQPEVRRVDDQVVAAGLDGRGLELLGQQLGHLVELGVPVVEVGGEVLPAAADGEGDAPHRVEGVGARAHRLDPGIDPHPLLGGHRPGQVGVVLVLEHLPDRGRRVVDRRTLPEPLGPVDEQRRLLRDRHVERVHVVRRDPGDVGVHRLGGDLHRRAGHLRGHLGHRHRGLRDPPRLVGGQHHPGGEPPRPAVDHPHREADVVGVERGLEHSVADREVLVPDPLEAEVRVVGPQLLCPTKGNRAELAVGEGGEARIDLRHGSEPIRPLGWRSCQLSLRGAVVAGHRCPAQRDHLVHRPAHPAPAGRARHQRQEGAAPAAQGGRRGAAGLGLPRPVPGRRRTPG